MNAQCQSPSSGYETPDEEPPPLTTTRPRQPLGFQLPPEHTVTAQNGSFSAPPSVDIVITKARGTAGSPRVTLRDRICCYQWTWFTMTMATGGVANALFSVTYEAQWLTVIGIIFLLLNMVLFFVNCVLITLRFCLRRGSFLASLTDPVESLFIPAFFVSLAIIYLNVCEFGIPYCGDWLLAPMEKMFWIYTCASVLASAGLYLVLWSTQTLPLHTLTPVWVLPAYPLLLSAPIASSLVHAAITTGRVHSIDAVTVALAAITVQGVGFLISFMILAAFLHRLMTQESLRDDHRPGVFISIGPSAFTVAGIVSLGNQAGVYLPPDFMGTTQAASILKMLATMIGLSLWGFSIWFFLVSVGSLWKYCKPTKNLPFDVTWYSFVFPNTALTTATEQLGNALGSPTLNTVGNVLAVSIVIVWFVVFSLMIRALWKGQLLWPQGEGGGSPYGRGNTPESLKPGVDLGLSSNTEERPGRSMC